MLKKLIEADKIPAPTPPVGGDGKGVFLADMNDDEYDEYVEKVDRGWGGFIKKALNLNKNETNS